MLSSCCLEYWVIERFSTGQQVLIIKTLYQNGECATQAVRKLRTISGRNEDPCESTVRRLVTKFETTVSVLAMKSPDENVIETEEQPVLVQDSVIANPGKQICRCSQQLDIPSSLLHRILHKDLHMQAYKIQLMHNLKPADHGRGRRFVDWVLERLEVDNNFAKRIIFNDEVHFHLNGFVEKQNSRILGK